MQANKTSPEFNTKYKSTEQLVEINFAILLLRLHQEGLTEILQFANKFQKKMEEVLATRLGGDRIASAGPPLATIEEDENEDDEAAAEVEAKPENKLAKSPSTKLVPVVDSVKVRVVAQMEQVAITLENSKRPITNLKIQNLNAGVVMKSSYTEVTVKLQDIIVEDLNQQSIHSTVSCL